MRFSMRKVIGSVLLVLILSCAGITQVAATDSNQATTEDVLQMFKEMHFEQQMANVQTTMVQQMQGMFQNLLKGEQFDKLPADKKAKLQEFMKQCMKDAVNLYPVHEIVNDFAPMYAKYL